MARLFHLPFLSGDGFESTDMTGNMEKGCVCGSLLQNIFFYILVAPLIFRDLFSFLVECHHYVVLKPNNGLNHLCPPDSSVQLAYYDRLIKSVIKHA